MSNLTMLRLAAATLTEAVNAGRLGLPVLDPKQGTAVAPALYRPDPGVIKRRRQRKRERQDRRRGRGERE